MKIINSFFILFTIIFGSCTKTEYEKKERLENRVIGKTWRQLKSEKNLLPVGEGGSITPGNEFLGLYFQYFQPLTIDEARELVIYAAETFLNNLNSNEKLNELLDNPYPMDWIQIEIFIRNPDYSYIDPPGISFIGIKKNIIKYESDDGKKFEIIHEEKYEEALEKLK